MLQFYRNNQWIWCISSLFCFEKSWIGFITNHLSFNYFLNTFYLQLGVSFSIFISCFYTFFNTEITYHNEFVCLFKFVLQKLQLFHSNYNGDVHIILVFLPFWWGFKPIQKYILITICFTREFCVVLFLFHIMLQINEGKKCAEFLSPR